MKLPADGCIKLLQLKTPCRWRGKAALSAPQLFGEPREFSCASVAARAIKQVAAVMARFHLPAAWWVSDLFMKPPGSCTPCLRW